MPVFSIQTRKKKSSLKIRLQRSKAIDVRLSSKEPNLLIVSFPKGSLVEENARKAGKKSIALLRGLQIESVYVEDSQHSDLANEQFVEGILLSSLTNEWSSEDGFEYSGPVLDVSVAGGVLSVEQRERIAALCESVQQARRLVAAPPNLMGPIEFCSSMTKELSERVQYEIRDEKWLQRKGFGLLLSVGKSGRASRLLEMHVPAATKDAPTVLVVGKGVTFDSGGLDLKPPAGMLQMKYDMAGGAAAASLANYAASQFQNVHVRILVPLVENLVNLEASRPSDVYKAYSGLTVEITNTDAEGRLILADSLAYGIDTYKPDYVVDVATLTGAATMIAGWNIVATCSDAAFEKRYVQSSIRSGERAIALPLWPEYENEFESSVADTKNATNTRNAGTLAAAAFLSKFVAKGTKWLHLDIAAAAWNKKSFMPQPEGPTGAGVRSLAYWLRELDAQGQS